jgi:hypothetical protein
MAPFKLQPKPFAVVTANVVADKPMNDTLTTEAVSFLTLRKTVLQNLFYLLCSDFNSQIFVVQKLQKTPSTAECTESSLVSPSKQSEVQLLINRKQRPLLEIKEDPN